MRGLEQSPVSGVLTSLLVSKLELVLVDVLTLETIVPLPLTGSTAPASSKLVVLNFFAVSCDCVAGLLSRVLLDRRPDLPKSPLGLVRRPEGVEDSPLGLVSREDLPLGLVSREEPSLPPNSTLVLVRELPLGLVRPLLLSGAEKLVRGMLDLSDILGLKAEVSELLFSPVRAVGLVWDSRLREL